MISIFKTNIMSSLDLDVIRPHFNALHEDLKWNVDLLDCDKILRVDAQVDKNEEIISIVKRLGFTCVNLETFYSEPSCMTNLV